MGTDAKSVALAYIKAFEAKDMNKARSLLHDKGLFKGPIQSFDSADAFAKEMGNFMHITRSVHIKKVLADDSDVCIFWDYETTIPSIPVTPIAEWYKVEDGKIRSLHLHFNAVPFVAAVQKGEMAEALKSKPK